MTTSAAATPPMPPSISLFSRNDDELELDETSPGCATSAGGAESDEDEDDVDIEDERISMGVVMLVLGTSTVLVGPDWLVAGSAY